MKPKSKRKIKRYFGLRLHPGWSIKKGTKFITWLVEVTGIPAAYSSTVAWFTERLILLGVCIAAVAFAAGILFTLYAAAPIADSQAYTVLAAKAEDVKEQIIDITTPLFAQLIDDNRESNVNATVNQLATRKAQLKNYLASKDSPLADDDAALTALVNSKNMKLIIAISFVESDFGKHCYYYNCSGIGGAGNLRKYVSFAAWIEDFDNLLEARYKGLPPAKFVGLYVQPGSPNWIYGVNQVLGEMNKLGIG